jgi:hypothetical protein
MSTDASPNCSASRGDQNSCQIRNNGHLPLSTGTPATDPLAADSPESGPVDAMARRYHEAIAPFGEELHKIEEIAVQLWFRIQGILHPDRKLGIERPVEVEGYDGAAKILQRAADNLRQMAIAYDVSKL